MKKVPTPLTSPLHRRSERSKVDPESFNTSKKQPQYYIPMQLNNKVQLIGHLGMKPDIRTFGDSKMARVSIATDGSYRTAEGKYVQNAHWHTLVIWGKLAAVAEKHLDKGKKVAVNGKLVNRSYEDKEGKKNYTTEVHVAEFLVLEK